MNMRLDELYKPIQCDLSRVADIIKKELKSEDAFISRLSQGLTRYSGKHLRSALTIFSAYAVLDKGEKKSFVSDIARLAAGIELIHGAALIHDDVMDHAVYRRNQPSLNASFGYEPAIAFGDYMYSKGMDLIARLNNPEIIKCVAQAALGMCEGELMQVMKRGDLGLKKHTYMTIIKKKTALLMSSSCASSVILINKDDRTVRAFSAFGLNFGVAFQIVDDCLDIIGNSRDLGKPAGSDIEMGEMTLPLIYATGSGLSGTKRTLKNILRRGKMSDKEKEAIIVSGAIHKAADTARMYIDNARRDLGEIKESLFKKRLIDLTEHVFSRLLVKGI